MEAWWAMKFAPSGLPSSSPALSLRESLVRVKENSVLFSTFAFASQKLGI